MRFRERISAVAFAAALAFAGGASAPAAAESKHIGAHDPLIGANHTRGGMRTRLTANRHSTGFVALVGDKDGGLGFYPLPWHYRVGAWRARQRQAIESSEAIHSAIAADATGYDYLFPGGEGYGLTHHHGIFNPVDGYGSPFFAGYYGSAGAPDDDPGPLGRPYPN
ncbi:MAG: hypothetical protein WDN46_09490 [Methylocella sp.]